MSEDSQIASIKRVMDNPGLAFLKQMHNPKVYDFVYGKSSDLYKNVMKIIDIANKNKLKMILAVKGQ